MAKAPATMKKSELARLTKAFPDWKIDAEGKKAVLTVTFNRHVDALVFITRVSVHAVVLKHYPEIVVTEATVKITTASGKVLADLDLAFMKRVDHVLRKRG